MTQISIIEYDQVYHKKEITAIKAIGSGVILFILKPISHDEIHYLWVYGTLRKKNNTCKKIAKRDKCNYLMLSLGKSHWGMNWGQQNF